LPAVSEDTEQFTFEVAPRGKLTCAGQVTWMAAGDVRMRLTLPEKPYWLDSVSGSIFEEPALKDNDEGPVRVKSEMVTLRTTLWVREPKVPAILRVYSPAGR
jgi:hypothetical protein